MTNGVIKGYILCAQIRKKFNLKNNNCYIGELKHIVEVVRKGQVEVTSEIILIDSVFFMKKRRERKSE